MKHNIKNRGSIVGIVLIVLLILASGIQPIWAQSGTSAAGIDASGTGGSISLTIGLIDFVNDTGTGGKISEGVQQPFSGNSIITGTLTVCTGSVTTLTDTTSGGTWSSSNTLIATVSSGIVTGVSTGVVTISYSVSGTVATASVTVSTVPVAGTISGSSSICITSTSTLSCTSTGGVWSSVSTSIATITTGGVVTGVSNGTSVIHYTTTNSCGTSVAYDTITVSSVPSVAAILGDSLVCTGSTDTLTESSTGGTWSASNANATVSGGIVTGISSGIDTIHYSATYTCGSASAAKIITINALPVSGTLTGLSSVCAGSSITLMSSATGGTWSATNGDASVSGGVVTGMSAGIDTIQYSQSNYCGTVATTHIITVNSLPVSGTIIGSGSVCTGVSITLTDSASGGVWSATNAFVTVSGGIVTGVSSGVDTIYYAVTNLCGTNTAAKIVSVNPVFTAGVITGSALICTGTPGTLSDTTFGGIWSASNANATVAVGIVTAIAVGLDTISYTVSNACGYAIATTIITINSAPPSSVISGPSLVCPGTTITLADTSSGGVWGATNGFAVVAGGIVAGISSGIDTIHYSVTNECGTSTATVVITVDPILSAGVITGSGNICIGVPGTLSDTTSVGTWSASNGNATILSGVITGLSSGTDTILYTVSNACGSAVASAVVTINVAPVPSAISGPALVCSGASITLTDSLSGGTWSTTNGFETVAAGIVTGISSGVDTIQYSVTNLCGTITATKVVTVYPAFSAGVISGILNVCTGMTVTLSDTTSGGTWGATNVNATVSAGIVTGVSNGVDTILYLVPNVCGTAVASRTITISPTPFSSPVSGPSYVCPGTTITLSDLSTGGTWSSSNISIATVSDSGVVTGVVTGAVAIYYTVSNVCGFVNDTDSITVSALPHVDSISGGSSLCILSSITLSDMTTGGIWSTVNGHAAISSAGVLSGLSVGIDTILYIYTNSCGSASASKSIILNPFPNSGVISGSDSMCIGSVVTLYDSTGGGTGTWSSSNMLLATVTSGAVTTTSVGIDTIRYSVSNGCGTANSRKRIIIVPMGAGTISGTDSVCQGSAITLTDSVSGGTWSVFNANASIAAGILTGITAGPDTVQYHINNVCGISNTTMVIVVDPMPYAGSIVGLDSLCIASSATFTDSTIIGIGAWSVSNSNAAISGSTVTGVALGFDSVIYSVTNSCGNVIAYKNITVRPASVASTLTGLDSVCPMASITLTPSITGGAWTCSNVRATVTSGIVTGVASGIDSIIYSLSDFCGISVTKKSITIKSLPVPLTVIGADSLCEGSTTTLTVSDTGGVWSSSGSVLVTGGIVTAVAPGVDTLILTISNSCGDTATLKPFIIKPLPYAGTITGADSLCIGASTSMTDFVSGGSWSVSNHHAADSLGVITGITRGLDTVFYTYSNFCGTAVAQKTTYIKPLPHAAAISGSDTVCEASSITLSDSVVTGFWHANNAKVAVVGGFVSAISPGLDTIYYIVSNSCGSDTARKYIDIKPLPIVAGIIGNDTICIGLPVTFTDTTLDGLWSATNANAIVAADSGIIHPVNPGRDSILYSKTNACGTRSVSKFVTVIADPSIPQITGPTGICLGTPVTLTDSIPGGLWQISNSNAILSGSTVTGINSGSDTVTYTVSSVCGMVTLVKIITIDTVLQVPAIIGGTFICIGTPIIFTGNPSGGTWSCTDTNANINTSGILNGVVMGWDTVKYTIANSCGHQSKSSAVRVYTEEECDSANFTKILPGLAIHVLVYPNPNSGSFIVELPADMDLTGTTIKVTDLLGKLVWSQNVVTNASRFIDISLLNIASAAYFVQVNMGESIFTTKVVIIK